MRRLERLGTAPAGWLAILLGSLAITLWADTETVRILAMSPHYAGDFTVFWTATRMDPADLYDARAITEAQWPLVQQTGWRPFVNPPSALPWLEPFGSLPFWPALVTWSTIGSLAYLAAAGQFVQGWRLLLVALSPVLWIAATTGQFSLLLGAAILTAVATLPTRPLLAGMLLGLVATVKPQMVVMAPLALIAAREWRALAAALTVGLAVGLVCLALQGPQLWLDWLAALRGFPAILGAEGLMAQGVTPLSLPAPDAMKPIVFVAGAVVGAVVVWLAFVRSADPALRLLALVVGGLLVSPYGMGYDLAPLQPVAVLLLLDRHRGPVAWLVGLVAMAPAMQPYSVLALGLATLSFAGLPPQLAAADAPDGPTGAVAPRSRRRGIRGGRRLVDDARATA